MTQALILASKSAARKDMLEKAGLRFKCISAEMDERALEDSLPPDPNIRAEALARAKAEAVSLKYPDALVIGADQILSFDGKILHKAKTRDDALAKLRSLSGQTHELISAAALAQSGKAFWQCSDTASLTMRNFEDAFLETYAGCAGDALTSCVGAYALEGAGAWLFEKTEGDFFTILGLPLLQLLGALREKGWP